MNYMINAAKWQCRKEKCFDVRGIENDMETAMQTTTFGAPPAQLSIDGGVATITLNRPESCNALDEAMADALLAHAQVVAGSAEVRVVLIRGAGASFCAGGDLKMVLGNLDRLDEITRRVLGKLNVFVSMLRRTPQIVVSCVHGAAAGAGFSIAMMADLCVAVESARFVPAYARLGVSPDCGGTVGIMERIGAKGALNLFLLEDELSAAQAAQLGLVSKVFSEDKLDQELAKVVDRLLRISPLALAATKRLAYGCGGDLAARLDAEADALVECMQSAPYRAALDAFIHQRGA